MEHSFCSTKGAFLWFVLLFIVDCGYVIVKRSQLLPENASVRIRHIFNASLCRKQLQYEAICKLFDCILTFIVWLSLTSWRLKGRADEKDEKCNSTIVDASNKENITKTKSTMEKNTALHLMRTMKQCYHDNNIIKLLKRL